MESVRRLVGTPIPWMVALNLVGVSLITPVLPAYATHFDVSIAAVSTLLIAFAVGRMVFRLPAGALADKFGSRRICFGGGLVQAAGALIAALAPSLGVLLIARAVQGLGSALFGTSINRYVLVVTDRADLGRATAGLQGGILIGGTIGPLIGGVFAQQFGIFGPFYAQAGIALALALSAAVVIRDAADTSRASARRVQKTSVRSLLTIPGFGLVMFLGFGLFVVRAGAINVVIPAFADDILAMSPAQIGAVVSLGSIVSLIVMPWAGHMADSIGRLPIASLGAFLTASTIAVHALADNTTGLYLVSALSGVGIGFCAVAFPTIIGDIAPPGTEGRATGVYRMANDAGWIVGPATLGLLASGSNYGTAFIIAGIPLLLGGLLLLRIRKDGDDFAAHASAMPTSYSP
jgi:DHA1 family multidrug resistance protein-like MFS transporter